MARRLCAQLCLRRATSPRLWGTRGLAREARASLASKQCAHGVPRLHSIPGGVRSSARCRVGLLFNRKDSSRQGWPRGSCNAGVWAMSRAPAASQPSVASWPRLALLPPLFCCSRPPPALSTTRGCADVHPPPLLRAQLSKHIEQWAGERSAPDSVEHMQIRTTTGQTVRRRNGTWPWDMAHIAHAHRATWLARAVPATRLMLLLLPVRACAHVSAGAGPSLAKHVSCAFKLADKPLPATHPLQCVNTARLPPLGPPFGSFLGSFLGSPWRCRHEGAGSRCRVLACATPRVLLVALPRPATTPGFETTLTTVVRVQTGSSRPKAPTELQRQCLTRASTHGKLLWHALCVASIGSAVLLPGAAGNQRQRRRGRQG